MSVCVLLCRDCCCGTQSKHPEFDHGDQEHSLRQAAADGGGKLIRTRCLGICERSNVVVVKTRSETHWFEGILSETKTEAIANFVRAAGALAPPDGLAFQVVARRTRCP